MSLMSRSTNPVNTCTPVVLLETKTSYLICLAITLRQSPLEGGGRYDVR